MINDVSEKYIVFSYNFSSDRFFAMWLSQKLSEHGISNWFFDDEDTLRRSLSKSRRDTRYQEDWRLKPQNWQATFLHQVQHSQGVAVVQSIEAIGSTLTVGRGMWREADAVEYIRLDNPKRIKIIDNPTPYQMPTEESLVDLPLIMEWAEEVLALPPVSRPVVTYKERAAFNKKLDTSDGPIPAGYTYKETKTPVADWYELVRLDLYDVMWFCRRCSVESDNYILGTELPPPICPICGFKGH